MSKKDFAERVLEARLDKLILDLDFCLFDTDSMRRPLGPVFERFFSGHDFFSRLEMKGLIDQAWSTAPHDLVKRLEMPDALALTFLDFYRGLQVPAEAVLYADVQECLTALQARRAKMFLVSKGIESFQAAKVAHCDIGEFFAEVVYVGPDSARAIKREAMQDIFSRHRLNPADVWVVGDSKDELSAGQALDATTVQTLRPGIKRQPAHHHVTDLHELVKLLQGR